MTEKVEAYGDGSNAVGRDIINSIIVNKLIIGGNERLCEAIIQPSKVFERVDLSHFVGREWLRDEIDNILRNNDNGYIVLEADAGLGKTAFLAWLVKERNYIHHFVELARGQEGIERGLKNIAAQLIMAYQLSPDDIIPNSAARSDYLYRLLEMAAKNRYNGEKIIIVVDALDEAGILPNQNALGLPSVLPKGVFFIVSKRPVHVALHVDRSITRRWPLTITADSKTNLNDMHRFLENATKWPGVAKAMIDSGYTSQQLIAALMEKCRGVWIYLNFVINEVDKGERSPLDLDALPDGLWDYYAKYWLKWRGEKEWYDLYISLLTTLAAAQETIELEALIELSEIKRYPIQKLRLRSILKEQWRPFLMISNEDQKERYRFYHSTVRDFFEGKVDRDRLLADENAFISELADATRDRHKTIAERYLKAWGGLNSGLPYINEKKEMDDSYGLRNLAAHLEASGQENELHYLLALETDIKRNLWYDAKDSSNDISGYINDVMRAWRCAEKGYNPTDITNRDIAISLQIRYSLIITSVNSLSTNIPSDFLIGLMISGQRALEYCLAYARQIPDPMQRAMALTQLSSQTSAPLEKDMIEGIIEDIEDIHDSSDVAKVLSDLIPFIPETHKAKILAIAWSIQDEGERTKILREFIHYLPDALMEVVLSAAQGINDEEKRGKVLSELMLYLPETLNSLALTTIQEILRADLRANLLSKLALHYQEPQKSKIFEEAIATAHQIQDDEIFAKIFSDMVKQLPQILIERAFSEALKIRDDMWRAKIFSNFWPHLTEPMKDEALKAIRKTRKGKHAKERRIMTLSEVAQYIQEPQRNEIFKELLYTIPDIRSEEIKAKTLSCLIPIIPVLSEELFHRFLHIVEGIQDRYLRAKLLCEFLPYSHKDLKMEIVDEGIFAALKIRDDKRRAEVLSDYAQYLPEAAMDRALIATRNIQDEESRTKVLSVYAKYLPEDLMDKVLNSIRNIREEEMQAKVLSAYAPYFPEALVNDVLIRVGNFHDEQRQAKVLSAYVPYFPKALLNEVIVKIRNISCIELQGKLLTELAIYHQSSLLNESIENALIEARKIRDRENLIMILSRLAPFLPETLNRETLIEARKIRSSTLRARALYHLTSYLPNTIKDGVMIETLSEYLKIFIEKWCDKLTLSIKSYPDSNKIALQDRLINAKKITDEELRVKVLLKLIPSLHSDLKREAIEITFLSVQEIDSDVRRAKVLSALINYAMDALEKQDLEYILKMASKILNPVWRADALSKIASRLSDDLREEAVQKAVTASREIRDEKIRAKALSKLIPFLSDPLKKEVI
jgi:hypothetical protein